MRTISTMLVSVLLATNAFADEVRRPTIPAELLGTWAETAEKCAAKDKSNVSIEAKTYGDAQGSCMVQWVVVTAAPRGTNYAVHSVCKSASQPTKTQLVNILIRPQGKDQAAMGRSFDDLKPYQHCAAQ
jgi:hypothetical protein